MRLQRRYQTRLSSTGTGQIDVSPNNGAMEWKLFQVSVLTQTMNRNCMAALVHNDAYLHSTPNGSLDAATGPPYPIINSADVFSVYWSGGTPNDQATLTIWYDEVPVGSGIPS